MSSYRNQILFLGFLLSTTAAALTNLGSLNGVEEYYTANLSEVRYLLWTRSNDLDEGYYALEVNDSANLAASPFDSTKRTYFLIHGFGGYGEEQWILDSKTNVLSIEDVNVISVDYRSLVDMINYDRAVSNMYEVANHTASYIDWLTQETPLVTTNIHITGHSLGGQCAGMTAQYVTVGLIDRVTALDPAGPLFYNKSSDERVDKSDASYVDIIHTNSCPIYSACVGLGQPTGHVDFYPNGGSHQAGCTLPGNITGEIWLDLFSGCSHARSHSYWVESILAGGFVNGTELTFVSWPCTDWETFEAGGCPDCGQGCLEMGFHVNRSLEGLYYLITNPRSPFAAGDTQD